VRMWWQILASLVSIGASVLLLWLVLLLVLWCTKPDQSRLQEGLRLLPDVLRLLRRLLADSSLSRTVRIYVALLLAYLLSPIDLVPDFIPILGYAEDAVIAAIALRSIVRRAGAQALRRHWPGTPHGLATIQRLIGLCDT
jgi:uncharacterized membrane protein YkvA (DUF1232 family)